MRNYRVMCTLAVHRFVNYVVRVGDAISQFLNVAFFLGDNPNESLSGRAWRQRRDHGWKELRIVIDWLFKPWMPNHCQASYYNDLVRARRLIAEADVKRFDMA